MKNDKIYSYSLTRVGEQTKSPGKQFRRGLTYKTVLIIEELLYHRTLPISGSFRQRLLRQQAAGHS